MADEYSNVIYENRVLSEKEQFQVRRRIQYDNLKPMKVQSFINNISFPKSLDELYFYATEHGCFNIEDVLECEIVTWTSPRWAKIGDIVFFMHSKTSISSITRLRTELHSKKENMSISKYNTLTEWIERGLDLYKKYGGKIFAIGRVVGAPEYISDDDDDYEDASFYHWGSRVYADIEVDSLNNPIDISEFNGFIQVSRQSGITGVFGKEYDQLRDIIKSKNEISLYFKNSESSPFPLSKVNPENWIDLTDEYRRCFMLESQFRSYYVDYLLRELGDRKTFYKECRCIKEGIADSFVDNMILFYGKYLPIEVKLSVPAEANIKQQLIKYCYDDMIVLSEKEKRIAENVYQSVVLVIDTDYVYLFDANTNKMDVIYSLNDIRALRDVEKLRTIISSKIL